MNHTAYLTAGYLRCWYRSDNWAHRVVAKNWQALPRFRHAGKVHRRLSR